MKKLLFIAAAMLAIANSPAAAATITFTSTPIVGGTFDVSVVAQDLFAGRDPSDVIISYGFDVAVNDTSIISFLGATSGSMFDPATTEPGTDVFGAAFGQNGFGVEPGAPEPLLLATLHFAAGNPGTGKIFISTDLNNLFQGLQFFNDPFQESIAANIAVQVVPTAVPEPATLMLSGAGLLAAAWRSRKKRR
jgi:PEP-CTERM motif